MSMWFMVYGVWVFTLPVQADMSCLDLKSTTISSAVNAESLVWVCILTMPHGVSRRLGGGKPTLSLVSCKV